MVKIDHSRLNCYQQCPFKYYLTNELGLIKRTIDESNVDREFGKYVHSSLARIYRGKIDEALKVWDSYKEAELSEEVECTKTKENGIKLIEAYIKDNLAKDKQQLKILDVEKLYETPITDEVIWQSKVDTAIEQNENIYSLEHKTTGKMAYNYFYQFSPNQQITGQVFSLQYHLKQCSGVIVNAMEVGFRKRAYKGEEAGFHCKFAREIINRNKEQIEDFKSNVLLWTKRLIKSKEANEWGKVESACHSFRGCSMKEICLTSVGLKLDEEIVEVLYRKQANPLAYLEES